jgi:hypothetical protein
MRDMTAPMSATDRDRLSKWLPFYICADLPMPKELQELFEHWLLTSALARAGVASVEALVAQRDAAVAAVESRRVCTCASEGCDPRVEPCPACRRKIHESWHEQGMYWIRANECHPECPGALKDAAALAPREPASPQAAPAASDPAEPECIPPYPNFGSVGGGSGLEMKSQREWEAKYGPPPGEPGSRVEVSSDGNLRRKQ